MRNLLPLFAVALLAAGLLAPGHGFAQQNAVVDGQPWLESTPEIRPAFLLGVGYMITLETACANRKSVRVSQQDDP